MHILGESTLCPRIFARTFYLRVTRSLALTVDKVAVKAAIEAGVEVTGAKLVTDKTTLGRK